MSNLTEFQPQESLTVQAIYDLHKKRGDSEVPRTYLGGSVLGHECDRFLWYGFRQCFTPEFSGRMYRLFETGHLEEPRFIKELRGIGCEVVEVDEQGEQIGVVAVEGHFRGHLDAIALGVPEAPKTWHVCEFKTHSSKSYATLKRVGMKKAKPQHYAQIMVYMGLAKLTRALYLAKNKDTDEIYSERVRYDSTDFKALMNRAERIIYATQPPDRCANRPDDFRCRFCDAHKICWGTPDTAVPLPYKSCRTCCHATPEKDGDARWSCTLGRNPMRPCSKHLLIPDLVPFSEPQDAGDDWIEFKNTHDEAIWRHGSGKGSTWSTEELMSGKGPMDGGSKVPFDVKPETLLDRYPHEDSRLLWEGPSNKIDQSPNIDQICSLDKTDSMDTQQISAVEYDRKYLVVLYKSEEYAAIWEGVE